MALTGSEFKRKFLGSEEAIIIKRQLEAMVKDPSFTTQTYYTPLRQENISFVEKHMTYLSEHPKVKTNEYLSNLRLKTKIR